MAQMSLAKWKSSQISTVIQSVEKSEQSDDQMLNDDGLIWWCNTE